MTDSRLRGKIGTDMRTDMHCGRVQASGASGYCSDCIVHTRAFCAALDGPALAKLETLQSVVELQSEETLFMEGDEAASFFTVLTGALRISKLLPDGRRQITGFVLPGEFVGLSAAETYVDHAEALTDAKVCRFAANRRGLPGNGRPAAGHDQ
jgi:CRP/FNR family transcriptional regulator